MKKSNISIIKLILKFRLLVADQQEKKGNLKTLAKQ